MRILLTICMLGFVALGFSACGNDDDRVALVRSEAREAIKSITMRAVADNIDTTKPKAPKDKSWGEWIVKGVKVEAGLFPMGEKEHKRFMKAKEAYEKEADRWTIFDNGISPKGCDKGEVPLLWVDTKTGNVHLSPSKLSGGGFCNKLRDSYVTDKGNGDNVFNPMKAGDIKW